MRIETRKAVSNMIATLILIGIAVVAGIVVYSIFTSTSGTASSNSNIYITNIQANYEQPSGPALYSLTIKNSGSVAVSAVAIQVDGHAVTQTWVPGFTSSTPLAAGESASTTFTSTNIATSPAQPIGSSHVVTLVVLVLGGGSFTVSQTISIQ